ncbi:MAG: TonB-dependent receptor [Petrimonas sp.]|nr:TonB-dependent receptor [Petrimonas sp.]
MRKLYIIFMLTFCFGLCVVSGQNENRDLQVSGIILDENGESLLGANVYIKNEPGVGVVSGLDGKFTIKTAKNTVLVISFIDYEKEEILVIKSVENLTIRLKKSSGSELEEVVVVGHGQQRKVSVVGSISSVDVNELKTPSSSITNALAGKVAGIVSVQRSGEPGNDFSEFWIRGISTFGANQGALILIDGIERSGIDQIDPEDIESFSVLKDASATAVYGVRGANGVVLITTKKGSAGKLSIKFKNYASLSHSPRKPEYLGAYDYAVLANEARAMRRQTPIYDDVELNIIRKGVDPDLYPNVDWQKEILKNQTVNHNHYLSISGGGDVARYFMSASTYSSDALYKESSLNDYNTNVRYNKNSFRSNLDVNVTKSTVISLGVDGYLTSQNRPGMGNTSYIWDSQTNLTPLTVPVQYSTGQLPTYGKSLAEVSPEVLLNHTGYVSDMNTAIQSNIAINQDFSKWIKGLSFRLLYSFDTYTNHVVTRSKMPDLYYANKRKVNGDLDLELKYDSKPLQVTTDALSKRKTYLESCINYERTFNEKHRVGGLIHYFHQEFTESDRAGTDAIPERNQGLSGRMTYSLYDTYLIEANFGYTGSENFKRGEQFGFFPSVALGWIPTSYDWVKSNVPFLSFLKFRYSYGTAGNDKISNYRFPYFTFVEYSSAGWGGKYGITETKLGADNLRWEKALKSNIGIEATFYDKLSFVVDIFNDRREGIFQERTNLPATVGNISQPWGNVGTMASNGVDATCSYTHTFGKSNWVTLRGNFTYAKNVIDYWEEPPFKYPYKAKTGHIYGSHMGLIALGLFKDEHEILSSPKQFGEVLPGDIKYKDINGDGKIDTEDYVYYDYSDFPQITYGIATEVGYKNWTLSVFFQGAAKSKFMYSGNYFPYSGGNVGNVLTIAKDPANRWIPAEYSGNPATENPNARFPRLSYGSFRNNEQPSTHWLANNDYLRLKNVELGYRLKSDFLQKVALESVDISIIGENLWVWDNVKLWDPEQASYNGRVYPIQRTYTLNLVMNF